jgi:dTDP-4-dehydrorhamnose 3,5-epimerase
MTIDRIVDQDDRGSFARLFCSEELADAGWPGPVAQINLSVTREQGTVRGMHFQLPPCLEAKLVTCLRGEVWDVVVDLRAGSPTFLDWHGVHLCAEKANALLIPAGLAHGFQAMTDDVELIYCHSAAYAPQTEGRLNPLDPRLGIKWPRNIARMSEKDRLAEFIGDKFGGIVL